MRPQRTLLQHNQEFHDFIREGVPLSYKDASGRLREKKARVIDFEVVENDRFLAVRELNITRLSPLYTMSEKVSLSRFSANTLPSCLLDRRVSVN